MSRSALNRHALNRRDCLKIAGAAAVLPFASSTARPQSSPAPSTVEVGLKRLMLRHTWTTTMSSSEYRDTVQVAYQRDGVMGHGEGAPIVRYQEFPASAMKAIQAIAGDITAGDPWKYQKYLAAIRKALGDQQHAAMAAVDIAIFDWLGKKLDIPLYKFLGLDASDAPITDFNSGHHSDEDATRGPRPNSKGEKSPFFATAGRPCFS